MKWLETCIRNCDECPFSHSVDGTRMCTYDLFIQRKIAFDNGELRKRAVGPRNDCPLPNYEDVYGDY